MIKTFFFKQFVVEDDREQLVPNGDNEARRRSFSDREEQTQELRGEQVEASYGSKRIFFLFEMDSVTKPIFI